MSVPFKRHNTVISTANNLNITYQNIAIYITLVRSSEQIVSAVF